MPLLPLIQLLRAWGRVSDHPGPMCFFTVMMTHNTQPIQGNGCSKGITVDSCISQTKGPECLGFKVLCYPEPLLFLPITLSLLPCVLLNRGSWIARDRVEERNSARKAREMRQLVWEKCHITLAALRTQLTALAVFVEEKAC